MKSIKNTGFNQKTSKSHKFSSQITSFKHKTNETETKYQENETQIEAKRQESKEVVTFAETKSKVVLVQPQRERVRDRTTLRMKKIRVYMFLFEQDIFIFQKCPWLFFLSTE